MPSAASSTTSLHHVPFFYTDLDLSVASETLLSRSENKQCPVPRGFWQLMNDVCGGSRTSPWWVWWGSCPMRARSREQRPDSVTSRPLPEAATEQLKKYISATAQPPASLITEHNRLNLQLQTTNPQTKTTFNRTHFNRNGDHQE